MAEAGQRERMVLRAEDVAKYLEDGATGFRAECAMHRSVRSRYVVKAYGVSCMGGRCLHVAPPSVGTMDETVGTSTPPTHPAGMAMLQGLLPQAALPFKSCRAAADWYGSTHAASGSAQHMLSSHLPLVEWFRNSARLQARAAGVLGACHSRQPANAC